MKIKKLENITIHKRAENYTVNELCNLETINSRLYFQIEDFVSKKRNHPLFLTGGKGFGKTFNVMKAIIETKKGRKYTPSFIIFKKNERLEILKPIEGKIIKDFNLHDVVSTSNVIVFDDIHYLCDAVINGKFPLGHLLDLLEETLALAKKSKKPIIFISDEMLLFYADIIKEREFDRLLPQFGEITTRIPKEELIEHRKNIDYLVKLQLPSMELEEFMELFSIYGIEVDDFVANFLYTNTLGNPRGLIAFVNEFPTRKITMNTVIKMAKKRLIRKKTSKDIIRSFDLPILPFALNYKALREVINKFKTFSGFEKHIQEMNGLIASADNQMNSIKHRLWDEIIKMPIRETRYMRKRMRLLENPLLINKRMYLYKQIINFFKNKGILQVRLGKIDVKIRIPELERIDHSFSRELGIYKNLMELKKISKIREMSDDEFNYFWRKIPQNYANGRLDRIIRLAFRDAFTDALSEGRYLSHFDGSLLDDAEKKFQFIPHQHALAKVQQCMDEIDVSKRRICRLNQEKDQSFLDAEHFKRQGITAKEREKTNTELLNRLSRESARLQERIGNLESQNQMLRARNLQYEAQMDEVLADIQEARTIKGMTTDDKDMHVKVLKKRCDRQDLLALGKDTDAQICKLLGGKEVDGGCVVVETGVGEDEDVCLKVLKKR